MCKSTVVAKATFVPQCWQVTLGEGLVGGSGLEGTKADNEDVWVEPNIVSTDNARRDPCRMGKGRTEEDEEEEELLLEGSRKFGGGDGDTDPGMFLFIHRDTDPLHGEITSLFGMGVSIEITSELWFGMLMTLLEVGKAF